MGDNGLGELVAAVFLLRIKSGWHRRVSFSAAVPPAARVWAISGPVDG
jgi:hypothetical protein